MRIPDGLQIDLPTGFWKLCERIEKHNHFKVNLKASLHFTSQLYIMWVSHNFFFQNFKRLQDFFEMLQYNTTPLKRYSLL